MEYRKTPRLKFINKMALFYSISIFFFFSICALLLSKINSNPPFLDIRCPLTGKAVFHFRDFEETLEKMNGAEIKRGVPISPAKIKTRRLLSGPGSWPPRCTSKCGRCTPCKPVHVPVPPGTPVTTEYYPEAWRCKCGNKLYMP